LTVRSPAQALLGQERELYERLARNCRYVCSTWPLALGMTLAVGRAATSDTSRSYMAASSCTPPPRIEHVVGLYMCPVGGHNAAFGEVAQRVLLAAEQDDLLELGTDLVGQLLDLL
jgi:hypothetical protein